MSQIRIEETLPYKGHVRMFETDYLDLDRYVWERKQGLLTPVYDEDNVITNSFINAFFNRCIQSPGDRDTLYIGYQAVGLGTSTAYATDEKLQVESTRKAIDIRTVAGNQGLLITAFNQYEANCAQGRITTNYLGSGTDSQTTWTIAPWFGTPLPSALDQAYIAAYFKRFRVGDLIRFGLGANNTTYEYRSLLSCTYNAGATSCTISVSPLSTVPGQNATVDQCLNEASIIADYPTVQTILPSPAPTLTTFAVSDTSYIWPGDWVRLVRTNAINISGALFDLQQFGTVLARSTTSGLGTITLTNPGWAVDYPVNGSAPAPTPTAGQTGDQIYGGRIYNRVSGVRFVKSRQRNLMVETVISAATGPC